MPLTPKGEEIKEAMQEEYGPEKGERVLYASKNAGTISGIDTSEEDCADQVVVQTREAEDQGSNIGNEPPPLPAPEFSHPQEYPGGSAPPEPATGDRGFGMRDASVGYGGVTGGAIPQDWDAGDARRPGDAVPGDMSLADIKRAGEQYWQQWKGTE